MFGLRLSESKSFASPIEPGSEGVGRRLVVTADDFGIGPQTSRGILDLAHRGRVTCSVLLVNSLDAESSVNAWHREGKPMELGWHPCLTLDYPVSDPGTVRTLVDHDGKFHTLGALAKKLVMGKVAAEDVDREYSAQYGRFKELVGEEPVVINAHHHLHAFPVIGKVLAELLVRESSRPYVRRVREPLSTVLAIPGARIKRVVLTVLGTVASRRLDRLGFVGNDWLAGVTDNASVSDPEFFARWLAVIPGRDVELMCHPGEYDATLLGRDGSEVDGGLTRRVSELRLLGDDSFLEAVADAGFVLTPPSRIKAGQSQGDQHAA